MGAPQHASVKGTDTGQSTRPSRPDEVVHIVVPSTMPDTPVNAARVEALLSAPVGRHLVSEVAGVRFSMLLDALELPYPPSIAGFSARSAGTGRRRARAPWRKAVARDGAIHRRAVAAASPDDVVRAVRRMITDPDLTRRVDLESVPACLLALKHTTLDVGFTGHDEQCDRLLRVAADELRPVAEALVSSPAARWWWDDLPGHDQRYGARTGDGGDGSNGPPRGAQVDAQVAAAVEALQRDEAEARRRHPTPEDCPPNLSGTWWSIPIAGTCTSRPVPPVPAVHLACAEDPSGEPVAVWSLRIAPGARIFEVREPADWGRLVEIAPLDVTMSRLGDWRRWTGREGPFYLPDWSVVAEHFDGVHVTIGGYLTTRSVPVPVADGSSVLAGWDPDATFWLHDVTEALEQVGEWDGDLSFVGHDPATPLPPATRDS